MVTVPEEAGTEPDDASAVMAPSPSSERLPCARRRREHARRAGVAQDPPAGARGAYAPSMRETV
ncbi:hypothetical protein GCM10010220_23190 [Streptomyces parvulus]|nr:hypothetical protein GCM10010220_23190 [Streptomyces parvulus]